MFRLRLLLSGLAVPAYRTFGALVETLHSRYNLGNSWLARWRFHPPCSGQLSLPVTHFRLSPQFQDSIDYYLDFVD